MYSFFSVCTYFVGFFYGGLATRTECLGFINGGGVAKKKIIIKTNRGNEA